MFLRWIRLENILSFGPNAVELKMEPLTVLIGPNGSGKSNFIDVLGLLKALPTDFNAAIRERGGPENWAWQREPQIPKVAVGLQGPPVYPWSTIKTPSPDLSYSLDVMAHPLVVAITREQIGNDGNEAIFATRDVKDVVLRDRTDVTKTKVSVEEYGVTTTDSILTAIKDRRRYPEITHVGESLKNIQLYRNWVFGRQCPMRFPQRSDLRNNVLHEDGSNVGLMLNRLAKNYEVKQRLISRLRDLYEGLLDLHIDVEYGSVQVHLQDYNTTVPATCLSDGTLRYLYLLALLCDPSPPAMICLEEPELGLHPDILPAMARLLREASERCQLVVTTHSDVIVDALTDTPESIVVCEKHEGQTTLKRLRRDDLDQWLDRYRLGQLWSSGDIGGNRW